MSTSRSWAAVRERTAAMWGPRCWWCKVPTAATIEHLNTRSSGGSHWSPNLRLACPWCNFTRGDEPVEAWEAREGWRLPVREGLPPTVRELIERDYGGITPSGLAPTPNTNSRLVLTLERIDGQPVPVVHAEIRSAKAYPWRRVRFGRDDHPAVVAASDEFMRRYFARPGAGRPAPPARRRPRKRPQ